MSTAPKRCLMLQVRRSRVFVQVHKVSRRGPQRRVSVAQDFRALIAGRCVPPRRSGRRRAAYRTRDWVTSLFTELPRRTLLGNSYTALPNFYFTAVTVSRGTTSVDGVQNFPSSSSRVRSGMSQCYFLLLNVSRYTTHCNAIQI